jgi:hypothetical protein
LTLLDEALSVCRLAASEALPAWCQGHAFASITRTPEELSVIAPTEAVPAGVRHTDGWRALKVHGPFDFGETGVLSSLLAPLAEVALPVLAVCTFDTDYLLVRESDLSKAIEAIRGAGHVVSRPELGR